MRRGFVLAGDVVVWRNGGARERRAVRVRKDIVGMVARFEVEDLVLGGVSNGNIKYAKVSWGFGERGGTSTSFVVGPRNAASNFGKAKVFPFQMSTFWLLCNFTHTNSSLCIRESSKISLNYERMSEDMNQLINNYCVYFQARNHLHTLQLRESDARLG